MKSRTPNFFIVGSGTGGTTSLYEYLEHHPQVYVSPVKEPEFFCPDNLHGGTLRYPADMDRYLALFTPTERQVRVGEASTSYLLSELAPRLIHDFQPGARIVITLRDPIRRMLSMYRGWVARGEEDHESLEEALATPDDGFDYMKRVRVAAPVERWIDTFSRQQVHLIVFDDLVADPQTSLRGLLDFLEVDSDFVPRSLEARNASYRPRRWAAAASRPFRSTGRLALSLLLGDNNARRVSRRIRQSRIFRAPAGDARADIDEKLRQRLESDLRDDVLRLSRLTGRDLNALWFGRVP